MKQLFCLISLLTIGYSLAAQVQIEKFVLGSSGATLVDDNTSDYLRFTMGEAVIQIRSQGTVTAFQGFWYNEQSATVGIQSPNEAFSLEMYPNPTRGLLYWHSAVPLARIVVSDLSGKTVGAFETPQPPLDLHSFPVGMYQVQVFTESDHALKVYRLLKQ